MGRWSSLLPALFAVCVGAACAGSPGPDKSCATSAALQACPGTSVVRGVDVSTYQGAIDWTQVKAAKMDFAFARISDGTTHPDAQFAANWQGMKAAGVVRGSYQYFRASEDPTAQAN